MSKIASDERFFSIGFGENRRSESKVDTSTSARIQTIHYTPHPAVFFAWRIGTAPAGSTPAAFAAI